MSRRSSRGAAKRKLSEPDYSVEIEDVKVETSGEQENDFGPLRICYTCWSFVAIILFVSDLPWLGGGHVIRMYCFTSLCGASTPCTHRILLVLVRRQ
jgi:hypothetical protein